MTVREQYKKGCGIARLVKRDLGLMRVFFKQASIDQALLFPVFDSDFALTGGHVWRSQERFIRFQNGMWDRWERRPSRSEPPLPVEVS